VQTSAFPRRRPRGMDTPCKLRAALSIARTAPTRAMDQAKHAQVRRTRRRCQGLPKLDHHGRIPQAWICCSARSVFDTQSDHGRLLAQPRPGCLAGSASCCDTPTSALRTLWPKIEPAASSKPVAQDGLSLASRVLPCQPLRPRREGIEAWEKIQDGW